MIVRFVDPHFLRQLGDARRPVHEALGVLLIRGVHGPLSLGEDAWRLPGVHGGGREPRQAFVFVLVVVVVKERTTPRLGVSRV